MIKSYPTGNISKHMASLKVGETIRVKGPKGAFEYTPNLVRHFGMVAGGSGITPMLQIIRAVIRGRAAGDKTEIDLIYANVSAQDIILKEDLDALAKQDAGFRVHYILDNPPEGWEGGVGYVTADMVTVSLAIDTRRRTSSIWALIANFLPAMAAQACRGRQDPPVRPARHGQRRQEDHPRPGLREGASGEQAPGSGLCLLRSFSHFRGAKANPPELLLFHSDACGKRREIKGTRVVQNIIHHGTRRF